MEKERQAVDLVVEDLDCMSFDCIDCSIGSCLGNYLGSHLGRTAALCKLGRRRLRSLCDVGCLVCFCFVCSHGIIREPIYCLILEFISQLFANVHLESVLSQAIIDCSPWVEQKTATEFLLVSFFPGTCQVWRNVQRAHR